MAKKKNKSEYVEFREENNQVDTFEVKENNSEVISKKEKADRLFGSIIEKIIILIILAIFLKCCFGYSYSHLITPVPKGEYIGVNSENFLQYYEFKPYKCFRTTADEWEGSFNYKTHVLNYAPVVPYRSFLFFKNYQTGKLPFDVYNGNTDEMMYRRGIKDVTLFEMGSNNTSYNEDGSYIFDKDRNIIYRVDWRYNYDIKDFALYTRYGIVSLEDWEAVSNESK